MVDLVIKRGRIIDGTGGSYQPCDVSIEAGKIADMGKIQSSAKLVIDARGLVVCPGFIDTHSHSDLILLAEPLATQKIMQGITTEILGQDGLGEAPIKGDLVDAWRRYLSGLNGNPDVDWDWRSFADYLSRLEDARISTNVASLVGHGNIRLLAMGMEKRAPTIKELDEMRRLLMESLSQGAIGLSTGLIYPPCAYASTDEITELCKVVAEYNGIFVAHMRNEGDELLESIDEMLEIGRNSGASVHISHFKVLGEENWGKSKDALKKLQIAREQGIEVTVDQYPYTAGSTFLSSILPSWVHEGGVDSMLARLRDPSERARISEDLTGGDGGRGRIPSWEKIRVTSVKTEANRKFEGFSLNEISTLLKREPVAILMDLILQEDNAVSMIAFTMNEDDVRTIMRDPYQMVCTDGLMLRKPHPRVYGSFPRILGRYVRDKVIGLKEAIRKMTSLPAQRFGLEGRGVLKPGYWADITVFDPEKVIDNATYDEPNQYSKGIEYVIVNGWVTVEKGVHNGTRAGKVYCRGYSRG